MVNCNLHLNLVIKIFVQVNISKSKSTYLDRLDNKCTVFFDGLGVSDFGVEVLNFGMTHFDNGLEPASELSFDVSETMTWSRLLSNV